jgi:hypothetical protein
MYDISLKMYSDYDNTIAYAEKQGLERGIGIGIDMGIEQGIGIGEQRASATIAALEAEIERLKKQ